VVRRAVDRAGDRYVAHRVDHQIFQPPIHHQRRRLATANLVQNQNAALHSCLQTG
jgi:hypothetical protein